MSRMVDLNAWEDLYYRAQFRQVLAAMDAAGSEQMTAPMYLLQANVLFELGEAAKAEGALTAAVEAATGTAGENHRYALARLAYMNDQHKEARTLFSRIFEDTDEQRMRFKALLGIANSYADQGNWDHVGYLIEDLSEFPLTRDDDKICVLHFLGAYWSRGLKEHAKARGYYQQAMKIAAGRNWNYWVIRSLYGLALVAKAERRTGELTCALDILSAFVDGTEALFLSHMIQQEFEGMFQTDVAVEFDSSNMRMMIKDKWISFNDKPKLYLFLELLHARGQFVKKRNIAEALWPEENYIPGVHDPRIFDIAKRVRALIQENACDPVTLLSGRQGYKLAVCA